MAKKSAADGGVVSAAVMGGYLPSPRAGVLVHPALRKDAGQAAGLCPSPRAPSNLKGEPEILRFGIGLFSALAFLEAEGWPWRPVPEGWAMDGEGLPRWVGSAGPGPPAEVVVTHCALLHRLLGGRRPTGARPWPSVPRRHRAFAKWNEWFGLVAGEGWDFPCREALLELWNLARVVGLSPGLPAEWGVGFAWEPASLEPGGVQAFSAPSRFALHAAVDSWAESPAGPLLEGVHLAEIPPYPYAALEPLVARALDSAPRARAWMGERVGGGDGPLGIALGELLQSRGGGWLLWPAMALDGASRSVLQKASLALDAPLVLLDAPPGISGHVSDAPGAGIALRIHLLWLTPTAGAWYLEHARALVGPGTGDLLRALDGASPDHPRCGGPLVPPAPSGPGGAIRPWLGPGPSKPLARGGDSPEQMAAAGRLAELIAAARLSQADPPSSSEGRFWEGAALLLMGQPGCALDLWEGLESGGESPGRMHVFRARAYERMQDYPRARGALKSALALPLAAGDAALASLLDGQFLWLEGKAAEAAGVLEALIQRSGDRDERGQALCHLATQSLCADRMEDARRYLEDARRALPKAPQPFSEFLLAHRTGLALRKGEDFEGALARFEAAREAAASVGFRSLEAWAECDAGNTLRQLHRFDEAAACYRRAEEGGRGLGLAGLARSARFDLAVCHLEGGDLDVAERTFQASLDGGAGDAPLSRAVDCYWLALVRQQRGDAPGALELAERGLALLGEMRDPEVRLPLLILRGELLLLTGQLGKLRFLLKELKAEPEAWLSAAALQWAAAAKGEGSFLESQRSAAEGLVEKAAPSARAQWYLLTAPAREGEAEAVLGQAWGEAKVAKNAHLACRALWGLAERGALPALDAGERRWLGTYLTKNRIRGAERGLLAHLGEAPAPAAVSGVRPPSDLDLLSGTQGPPEVAREAILERLGASSACMVRPGETPEWWGGGTAEQRRALAAAAGLRGQAAISGGTILGCPGREGLWCGFFLAGRGDCPAESAAVARLWTRLVDPPRDGAFSPVERGVHPAVAHHILTRSPAMEPLLAQVGRAAAFAFPVLITGEPGSGKEVCAKAIHAASERASKPLVAANCANLTPTLATSLLFGHRRGAFTGADKDSQGFVEAARGGILFLDEVGELPPEVQANLLRFLQDGSYTPLGETRSRTSDARVVSATNRALDRWVAEGRFREDLYHRLNVIRIEVPPLRRRCEDVPMLFGHFLAQAAASEGKAPPSVDPPVLTRLAAYPWPGNVRELQNLARALLVEAHGGTSIGEHHLPQHLRGGGGSGSRTLAGQVEAAERAAIVEALKDSGGSPSAAARLLGISRQSLAQKVKRLGIGQGAM